ncbi:MAG TPA: hypothetical protein ACFE0H_06330, partial [Elainellaceae cyanobacterium]
MCRVLAPGLYTQTCDRPLNKIKPVLHLSPSGDSDYTIGNAWCNERDGKLLWRRNLAKRRPVPNPRLGG